MKLVRLPSLVGTLILILSSAASVRAADILAYSGNGYVALGQNQSAPSATANITFDGDPTAREYFFSGNTSQGETVSIFADGFSLTFTAPVGQPFQIGQTYEMPRGGLYITYPNSTPIFQFWGNGKGDNTAQAFFTILDLEGSDAPNNLGLRSFAADFVEIDGGGYAGRQTIGSIRYNSDIPVAVPEASTAGLFMLGMFGIGLLRNKRSKVCKP